MAVNFPITDRPVRFALVGCGRISANHLEALRQHAGRAELVAVCDNRPAALEAAVAKTGVVPMPASGERVLGGHAVTAVGYDDSTRRFIVRNSWGAAWGRGGCCFMPYAYLLDPALAADFWTIRLVEIPEIAK